jgi:hypothetical protein
MEQVHHQTHDQHGNHTKIIILSIYGITLEQTTLFIGVLYFNVVSSNAFVTLGKSK